MYAQIFPFQQEILWNHKEYVVLEFIMNFVGSNHSQLNTYMFILNSLQNTVLIH